MQPAVKVLVVVIVVLVAVQLYKSWSNKGETYIPWIQQEFETVPPQPEFAVTPPALLVNSSITQEPVLTQVAGALPAVTPTMVPTFVPTQVPAVVTPSPSLPFVTFTPSPSPSGTPLATPLVTMAAARVAGQAPSTVSVVASPTPTATPGATPIVTLVPTTKPSLVTARPASLA